MIRSLKYYAGTIVPATAACLVFVLLRSLFADFLIWFDHAAIEKQLFAFFIFFSISWIVYRMAAEGLQVMVHWIGASAMAVRGITVFLSLFVAIQLMGDVLNADMHAHTRIMCQLLVIQMPLVFIYDLVKRPGRLLLKANTL